jgi:dTDP-glucose 4,6-dehydratase
MRPGDGRIVPTFSRQALRGLPLTVTGDGSQTRSLCHVDDTVRGILAAASDLAGPVNIGNPDEATVLQITERVIQLSASRSGIAHIPLPEDDPMTRCPDITLARNALAADVLRVSPRCRAASYLALRNRIRRGSD